MSRALRQSFPAPSCTPRSSADRPRACPSWSATDAPTARRSPDRARRFAMRSARMRLSSSSEPCRAQQRCQPRAFRGIAALLQRQLPRHQIERVDRDPQLEGVDGPLISGAMSLRRKSATALVSSTRCRFILHVADSSRRKKPQQIDLGLGGAAADHGALHRMVGAAAKPLHHAAAHHAPAQRAHHFPECHAGGIDLAARRLVAREQVFARAETADRLVDLAEAPGVDADPAEILHRDRRDAPVPSRAPRARRPDR